ncbi:hypothetical protein EJB05_42515 [Eragrostis curvula]|uniref:MYB-CC type transcription factor LHEQLE-containing domain-containing protein n=1 Tax=Eragrostis curvula TaxID=38414 RepID=A0A5J9TCL9_9POAL|nr:hypothetical protein EJB05_42515 [Eragrostis curvula]
MYSAKPEASFGQTHTDPAANQQQMMSAGNDNNGANNNANNAARQRLRWTNELHERLWRLLLNLAVLIKYRLAKYIPDSSTDGNKADNKDPGDLLAGLEGSSGLQISEALKLQMEVQKRLHEQLECLIASCQRLLTNWEQRIESLTYKGSCSCELEAQGKYLQKIIEEQQRLTGVKSETPVAGASVTVSNEQFPDSERTEPSTPAPTSESPTQGPSNGDNGAEMKHPRAPVMMILSLTTNL